ncbi:class I SAM-dependent methyltransferase [Halocalculus aciditolerans]|uniref:Methyltransferase domain-containing protein n=1 Tax=Halocalculus aciditolerans TaxID=1383812 RepID=A0A830F3Z8_9EURY|nr:methyltransferase domain-containing protein [Halocalculus aciditolerans]GGL60380.1 hypothetical protein GCM10009039_18290 [Halocalculus aciditolerans]
MHDHGDHEHSHDHGGDGDGFDEEMHDVDWGRVRERQVARGEHVETWFDDAGIDAGDDVLEVGCGPGYVTERLAERVGEDGRVVAFDRQLGALASFTGDVPENVSLVLGDAESLPIAPCEPVTALVAYVLHHADRPARVLAELAGALPSGSRVFVAEYAPDADSEVGPPTHYRIAAGTIDGWLADAGFDVTDEFGYENATYAYLASVA